jgi:hypothetical protein
VRAIACVTGSPREPASSGYSETSSRARRRIDSICNPVDDIAGETMRKPPGKRLWVVVEPFASRDFCSAMRSARIGEAPMAGASLVFSNIRTFSMVGCTMPIGHGETCAVKPAQLISTSVAPICAPLRTTTSHAGELSDSSRMISRR